MNKLIALPFLALLAACGQEQAPAPQPTEAAAPSPTQGLPAPDQALFSETFAATCPEAEEVSTAVCRRAGIGSPEVICEFGLGEDQYRRHTATLTAGEGEWELAEPERLCAEHDSHHVDS